MTPKPEEPNMAREAHLAPKIDGESVVISGISGAYPQCVDVKGLSNILYNKVNPITASKPRWKYVHPEVPAYTGTIPSLDRYDAQFFKVHYRQAVAQDVISKKILEHTYQAIFDAGVSAEQLSGRNIGVYVGCCSSEFEKSGAYDKSMRSGFGISGCNKAMYANRISYWLNVQGPSMAMDAACCSSIVALEQACKDINSGECEAAIVGGVSVCLHPHSAIHAGRTFTLNNDGKTKCFSQDCDGLARAEALNVLFIQKAKNALRIYCSVLQAKAEFIPRPSEIKYGFTRELNPVAEFLENFYAEANIPPKAVEYVEAFGSAMPESDKNELEILEKVYCKDRQDSLLVGSVISNIGYSEAATGISAITKVCLGFETGLLAANLHCSEARRDVEALRDGRMRIITEHQPFGRSYVAVNNLSYTGFNAHVLLRGQYKPKDPNRYHSNIPRLVTISGRLDEAVENILTELKSHPIDPEELGLLHNVYEHTQPGHLSRGFIILDNDDDEKTKSVVENVSYYDTSNRPLWFVYSGMGSQWASMGTHLMRIPVFAAAIEKCHKVLAPKGIDILHIITSPDKTTFDNILHSFVGIAAIQIGLTDILTELGIVPDKIIGHSVGELGCGYADGCLTAKEMILAAYSRGLVSVQTPFIKGSMAAVGIGYQEVSKLCPPEIEVACHNGPESATISGPADAMRKFVGELTAKGIFAKEVPCSNIAYHSRYIAEAGPKLFEYLNEVIKNPKKRSDRWLSTSVPQEKWGEEQSQYCSAWYHTNNLLSSVLFEETSCLVPPGAVLLEIAPHGLLQAILKRSLPSNCRHIPLTKRGHVDNAVFVLEAIGKLFVEGFNPKVKALYPKIEFPVSTGTPMLSHLVKWSHSEAWSLPLFKAAERKSAAVCNHMISIHDDEHAYLQGNVVRGKIQYPFAAALVAVWDTLAMCQGAKKKQLSVGFRDVHVHSQPELFDGKQLQLGVTLQWGTGRFEVMNGLSKVANGFVFSDINEQKFEETQDENEYLGVDSKAVYDCFNERAYSYSGDFCSIHRANSSFTKAQLVWNNNWVAFIDGLLQLNTLHHSHNFVAQPSHIHKIVIDLKNHTEDQFTLADDKIIVNAVLSPIQEVTKCGGVQINKIKFYDFPPFVNEALLIRSLKFVPYFQTDCNDLIEIFKTYLQIVGENTTKDVIKVLEIANNTSVKLDIINMLRDIPHCTALYERIERDVLLEMQHKLDYDVILVTNLSLDKKTFEGLKCFLNPGTFIINGEQIEDKNCLSSEWYRVVSSCNVGKYLLELGRWKPAKKQCFISSFIVRTENDLAKLSSEREQLSPNGKLLVLTPHPTLDGLKDLMMAWRKDSSRNQIFLASITESDNEHDIERLPWSSFDFELVFNVLKNGIWGGEYYVTANEKVAVEGCISLRISTIGDLDSLHWVEAPEQSGAGTVVTVRYAGISDFDVKKATGVIPFYEGGLEEHSFGMDYSGTTESGEIVMGIVRSGAASGRVRALNHLIWPVPAHWSLEDAATVPLAYSQAFYCLGIKASLCPGMRVLVHGGAGALGQAAISIVLANQCEVFATVGSERKKHFLKKLFPQLEEDHISNSRNDSFGDHVLQLTKGRGCDIIISCVKGGLRNTTLKCGSYCGITFDTVQAYSEDTYSYGMYYMTKQRSFVVVDFDTVFDYEEDMKALQAMMSEGIARGYVRPLSRVTYAAQDAARAFRLLAASRHRGRALLRLRDGIVPARPRIACTATTSHLVFCDPEGIGLQLANRLIQRGAQKLRLLCTSALPKNLHFKVLAWKKQGVDVQVSVENIDAACLADVINDTIRMAHLEGVYMVLSGSNKKEKDILSSLDLATRKLSSLKYFVVLAINTMFGQKLCLSRSKEALPATFLNLSVTKEASWMSWQHILDVVECGLHSSNSVLLVQSVRNSKTSLFEQMAAVADVSLSNNNINDETELQQLAVDSSKAHIISVFLRNTYNISLEDEKIPLLTVKNIKEIEDQFTESEFEDVDGLHAFLTRVDPDELAANQRFVFLPTFVKNTKTRDEEIDVNKTYLIILPGMEGYHERFHGLCERLKTSALVLQPGVHLLGESLQHTARLYADNLRKKIHLNDNFYLLGYETGVKLALEVAAVLEQYGLTGTVYCVGGVSEEIEAIIKNKLGKYDTDEALQNALVRHMAELMANGVPVADLDAALNAVTSWKEKVQATVNCLRGHVTYSKEYTRLVIETMFARIKQFREDKVQPRALRSRLVVLRAADCPAVSDVQLQRYSEQPVVSYSLRAPIAHAAKDPRCAAVVNRHLSKDLLETFENLNVCDAYLKNAEMLYAMTKISGVDEDEE